MDAYSGYNQIKMDHMNVPYTTFMFNHENYYYNSMPFRLKNTYQPSKDSWMQYSQNR